MNRKVGGPCCLHWENTDWLLSFERLKRPYFISCIIFCCVPRPDPICRPWCLRTSEKKVPLRRQHATCCYRGSELALPPKYLMVAHRPTHQGDTRLAICLPIDNDMPRIVKPYWKVVKMESNAGFNTRWNGAWLCRILFSLESGQKTRLMLRGMLLTSDRPAC